MILTDFNRSSYSLLILISSLAATGCSQHSASHLAVDNTASVENTLSAEESVDEAARFALAQQRIDQSLQRLKNRQMSQSEASPQNQQFSAQNSRRTHSSTSAAPAKNADSVWGRMLSMYALPEIDHPRVTQEMENFLRHPDSLIALQRRAEPYLHMILDELEAKQMPGELALLPMIESSFRVQAYSHADAAGLWQFTPATAATFGLKQNWWYDGRLDVTASTEAATRYLQNLSEKFGGDWLLALASYNVGPRNVQKALRRNQDLAFDAGFWSLDLPQETMHYVPKLLALAKLFAHADEYGLSLLPIPNAPYVKAVDITSQMDLTKAAELAGMPLDEFFNLNPAFNHAITAPDGPYRLLVKAENAELFKEKLASLPKEELVKWDEHVIQEGDDLDSIARLHRVPVQAIIDINQLSSSYLVIGSVLRLPPKALRAFSKA